MQKIFKIVFFAGLAAGIILFAGWLTTRAALITGAESKAEMIAEQAAQEHGTDEEIVEITRIIFENFQQQDPAQDVLLRLRPYLTNYRLPAFIRLPEGVIETHIERGHCDNAARMLSFVLAQQRIESVQWDMVSPYGAHSALLVRMPDERGILADPFYGYVTIDEKKRLTHPRKARDLLKKGRDFDRVFLALGEKSEPRFYKAFADVRMAAQGYSLVIESVLPKLNHKPLTLGTIDGSDIDVQNEGIKNGLTPFWHYAGHKYNRGWNRVLKAEEPVKVVMTLLEPVDKTVLTAYPAPQVKGKTLSWDMEGGDVITFKDGLAKLSFKRLNSYIGVDQIEFLPSK